MKKNDLYHNKRVQINNIRYNQDNTLITLATSWGFRIISSKTFQLTHVITKEITTLGFLSLASVFFSSRLILFVGDNLNGKYKRNKLIVYDIEFNKVISFITLQENYYIIDFYITKNLLFIILSTQILVFDFLKFQIIQSIGNINIGYKLFSCNHNDVIAYTIFKNNKHYIIIKNYNLKNNQVISAENRSLLIPFEKIQAIQLSKSAQYIIVFSYLGNKIHIYYSDNGALKECIFIGEHIFSIENIEIYPHKEDSFFFLANDKMLLFYLIDVEDLPCVCEPYKDEIILGRSLSFFGYIKSYFTKVFYFYNYFR